MSKPKKMSREDLQLGRLTVELNKLSNMNKTQARVIAKNRKSPGWSKGYVAAYGARKAMRKYAAMPKVNKDGLTFQQWWEKRNPGKSFHED